MTDGFLYRVTEELEFLSQKPCRRSFFTTNGSQDQHDQGDRPPQKVGVAGDRQKLDVGMKDDGPKLGDAPVEATGARGTGKMMDGTDETFRKKHLRNLNSTWLSRSSQQAGAFFCSTACVLLPVRCALFQTLMALGSFCDNLSCLSGGG